MPPSDIYKCFVYDKHAVTANVDAALTRVEHAKFQFEAQRAAVSKLALADAAVKSAHHYRDLFRLFGDAKWETVCPACGGKAFMTGMQYGEEIVDTVPDEDGLWETVDKYFVAEEFRCPVCDLHLESQVGIEAVGLDADFTDTEEREAEYEPDYGND